MINISDFLVDKVIYQSHNTVVYQGKRLSDNVAVVIKALNNEYPDNYLIEHFENEYQLLKELDFDGIPRIYSLEKCQNGLAIIMEDFNGVSLKDLLGYSKTDIKEFLDIAIRIVDVLDFIHSKNIIHKDLNSSNILLNREEGVIKVIDFGISAKISSVKESQINTRLDGTLPYISPEQTGRMNKSLDYRTDFYSLGI
ncbi:MAG: serine/threonine protein kinase, partial [Gammaproteobacteria bacterium]